MSRFNCTLDPAELEDNMVVGNIANGYLKEDTLWIYFWMGCWRSRPVNSTSLSAEHGSCSIVHPGKLPRLERGITLSVAQMETLSVFERLC